ncbi:hypothetical protein OAG51_01565 [Pirellulaceae bacterium]|nr:hypothetical protein [Pirellulaceae bacterium]
MSKFSLSAMQMIFFLIVGFCFSWEAASGQDDFPYTVVVSSDTAKILSGPGQSHYATDRLPKGSKLEVHRNDPGGFLAIRPPTGSFSLVLASHLNPTTDPDVVEVASGSATAWIGTRLSGKVNPMWQLRLKKGELITVVKKVDIPDALSGQSESWFQIEPPAGEFRWVHKDHVGTQSPASVSATDINQSAVKEIKNQTEDYLAAKQFGTWTNTDRKGWQTVGNEYTTEDTSTKASVVGFAAVPSGSLKSRLEAMDLHLAQIVIEDKKFWNLQPLEAAIVKVRSEATTGDELAMADRLATKVAGFQKVKAAALLQDTVNPSRARLLPPTLTDGNGNVASLNTRAADRNRAEVNYQGKGVLRKLYLNGGVGTPIYALEDSNGKVLKTITPSFGLNLERYVGREVGLFGKEGFHNRLNQPHLTAQRVVDLDRIR